MNIKVNFDNIKVKETKKDFTVKILMLKGEKGEQGDLNPSHIVDNLTSNDSLKVLSAKQGKVLKDLVDKKPYYYNTVADMKSDKSLKQGDMAVTLGYYSINDGGGSEYIIVDDNTLVDDGGSIHKLVNGLRAELVISNDTINIKQLGAKPTILNSNEKFDNKNCLQVYESICNKYNKTFKLFIGNGYWLFSPTHLTRFSGFNIEGNSSFPREPFMGSVIMPYNSEQSYIWKFGGNADYSNENNLGNSFVTQTTIKNLYFTTNKLGYLNSAYRNYIVTDGLLILDCCMYWDMDNIYIQRFNGNGLRVRNTWEVNIGNLMFRGQFGFNYCNILFDKASTIPGIASNISAFDIKNLMFEGTDGKLIYSHPQSGFSHNHIGHINIENAFSSAKTAIPSGTNLSSFVPIDLISGFYRSLIIDSINYFQNPNDYSTDGTNNYYFRSLFATLTPNSNSSGDLYNSRFHVTIGTLVVRHNGDTSVVYSHDCYIVNQLNISSLMFFDLIPKIPFNLDSGIALKIGCVSKDENLKCEEDKNDAINYYSAGRDSNDTFKSCSFQYDEGSPTFLNLVVNIHGDGTGILFTNTVGTTFKIKVLYKSPSTQKNMTIQDTITGKYHTIVAPVTTGYEWAEQTFTNTTALGNKLRLKSYQNKIAKIIIESV